MKSKNFFYVDIHDNTRITWDDLLDDLRTIKVSSNICTSDDFYTVFRQIIHSILVDMPIVLQNKQNASTNDEVHRDEVNPSMEIPNIRDLYSVENLISALKRKKQNWSITLSTSGTTGKPKIVSHKFDSVTRFVSTAASRVNDVWGFAYNPKHLAGLQVFFQAILNGNSIVRLFGLTKTEIENSLSDYQVTNISATPTFYRLMVNCEIVFPKIRIVTFGGERFSEATMTKLKGIFPEAKFKNIYAMTEAGTIFSTEGNTFFIEDIIKDKVKIEDNLLYIHRSLLGEMDRDFSEWYNTGDIVEIVGSDPMRFVFISRMNDFINTGGYKVNPHVVEDVLLKHPGITFVRVYGKDNSLLGKVVVCDIVGDGINEEELRDYLRSKLEEYQIPRIFNFESPDFINNNGKISRVQ